MADESASVRVPKHAWTASQPSSPRRRFANYCTVYSMIKEGRAQDANSGFMTGDGGEHGSVDVLQACPERDAKPDFLFFHCGSKGLLNLLQTVSIASYCCLSRRRTH